MDVDDENKVDKNETNDKPEAKGKGASSGKSLNLFKKQWHHVPVIMIGVVGIVLLVAAVYGLFLSFSSVDKSSKQAVTSETIVDGTELTYTERAEQLSFYGEYDEAQELLQQGAINTQGDIVAKAKFYVSKAELAMNNGLLEDALVFAIQADDTSPTYYSAGFVAVIGEMLQDNQTAVRYFQLAAERSPEEQKTPGGESGEYLYYITSIKRLDGGSSED